MTKYVNKDIKHKFDSQSRLGYSIQGKRGGAPQVKDDVGRIVTYIDNDNSIPESYNFIFVDAFQGHGEDYHRREECKIIICDVEGVAFEGNFKELISKLKAKDREEYKIEPVESNVLD